MKVHSSENGCSLKTSRKSSLMNLFAHIRWEEVSQGSDLTTKDHCGKIMVFEDQKSERWKGEIRTLCSFKLNA